MRLKENDEENIGNIQDSHLGTWNTPLKITIAYPRSTEGQEDWMVIRMTLLNDET